jgi:hypothetical protein
MVRMGIRTQYVREFIMRDIGLRKTPTTIPEILERPQGDQAVGRWTTASEGYAQRERPL